MEVYGYEKFKEKNYWPIKIGSEDTRTDPAAKASSRTIPGYGMTKTVQPDAKNPVVLHSAFDTFARHVAEMSTYAGWLGTNENAVRLLNYQFQDADGNRDGTIKDRLKHIHGAGGTAYMEKLLGDIALGTKAGKDTIFSSGGMTSAFKSSAISANLRVILQQPTAILRAMEIISPKYFLTSLGQKDLMKGWETAKKYSPIAQWKDWGYFEIDTGRSYKEMMLEPKNLLDRTKGALMYPAGAADALGWGDLWKILPSPSFFPWALVKSYKPRMTSLYCLLGSDMKLDAILCTRGGEPHGYGGGHRHRQGGKAGCGRLQRRGEKVQGERLL